MLQQMLQCATRLVKRRAEFARVRRCPRGALWRQLRQPATAKRSRTGVLALLRRPDNGDRGPLAGRACNLDGCMHCGSALMHEANPEMPGWHHCLVEALAIVA